MGVATREEVVALLTWLANILIWNHEGWYLGKEPSGNAQSFRIMTNQKPYRVHKCKVCGKPFWSYKKPDTCYNLSCYMRWRSNATDTCKN